jgi:hypothetical protein
MNWPQIQDPVAPGSAIRANVNTEDRTHSPDSPAGKVVSSRRRMSTRLCRRSVSVDFAEINRAALASFPAVLRRLLPEGKIVGREFIARNPRRADRNPGSFKINCRTGRWKDFATGDGGGDPISLVAFLADVSQSEAARLLSQLLGMGGSR